MTDRVDAPPRGKRDARGRVKAALDRAEPIADTAPKRNGANGHHHGSTATDHGIPPARRFKLVPFSEIALGTERSYLIKGLIPREGLVVVWGPPKCGKSFKILDVVMHVALGWEYRGRRVAQGAICYIACEGERGLSARIEAFRRERLSETPEAVPFYLLATRLNLAGECEHLVADVQAQLGDVTPVAIVIDTLNRSLWGSESDDEDMAAYVRAVDVVREAFRCAVIVIHHCGVNGERPRGHSSLTGAADAQLAVKRDGAGQVVMLLEWMKDGAEGDQIVSRLKVVDVGADQDGEAISSCVIEPADGNAIPAKSKLPTSAALALEKLGDCIARQGGPAPASQHIPAGAMVVKLDAWKEAMRLASLIESDAKGRQAWKRTRERLQASGCIGIYDEMVWIVRDRATGGYGTAAGASDDR